MKIRNYFLTILSLSLATTVTAGSMFITLNAAALQESAPEATRTAVQDAFGLQNADPAVDEVPQIVPNFVPPLLPEEILHDRSQKIVLDSEGAFRGQLSALVGSSSAPASGYTVKVLQNGVAVAVTTTNEEGKFSFKGLQPGVAGILAFTEKGLMLFGAHLVAPNPLAGDTPEVQLSMDSAVVAEADVALARELILSGLTREALRFSEAATEEDDKFFYGKGEPSTSLFNQPIQLRPDGTLHGSVSLLDERTGRIREVLDMSVFFLRNGRISQSAAVNRNGSFAVSGLTPGLYSVVGKGLDGAFAVGVEVLAAESNAVAGIHSGDALPVSIRALPEFNAGAVGPTNLNSDNVGDVSDGTMKPPGPPGPGPNPQPGMGSGGGGAGGGGAGGGGGGLGALIGAIAGGIAGYVAGQNNNDNNPASPNK
jgi:hypothetical protein